MKGISKDIAKHINDVAIFWMVTSPKYGHTATGAALRQGMTQIFTVSDHKAYAYLDGHPVVILGRRAYWI